FILVQITQREQGPGQRRCGYGGQEIGLILARVTATQQTWCFAVMINTCVMARCNQIGAQTVGVLYKSIELDFPVTQDIRVGCAPGNVAVEKMTENACLVFAGKIGAVKRDVEHVANGCGIVAIIGSLAAS